LPKTTPQEARILKLLRNNSDRTFRAKEIARKLGIKDNRAFRRFMADLHAMAKRGEVSRAENNFGHVGSALAQPKRSSTPTPPAGSERTPRPPRPSRTDADGTVGRLTVHPNGFGFVAVDGWEEDAFIGDRDLNGAFDGDTVSIEKRRGSDRRGRDSYSVLEIVERGRSRFVGTLRVKGGAASVQPDDTRVPYAFEIAKDDLSGAQDGQKVLVRLKRFTRGMTAPEGEVESILGSADDPEVRVLALAMSLGAHGDFPDEVEKQAQAIPDAIPAEVIRERLDLRTARIFTIDPVDAKDFDDAIHVTDKGDGTFEVGVHIADVSHYVQPGLAIDQEAYDRGTSVYLVDRVIPMLPEHLSNGVCSLVPRQDRLAYSCIMQVTAQGEVKSWTFAETVIHSQERFSYEAAQAVLDGQAEHDYSDDLHRANDLAHTLTRKRMATGSIDFNLPEVKIVLDEDGRVSGVRRKERIDTNRLIEEFMLLANQCAAREARQRPFMYRIHEPPDPERIQALADYVRAFGFKLPLTEGNATSTDLNTLLSEVEGSPEAPVITTVALRSMSKARYGPERLGHYGLGFEHYSHFTSPIRRYPDLIAHRLLKRYTAGGSNADPEELADDGVHLSEREKAATTAERESVKLKQVEYLQDHLGETFDGVVSGVAKFGLFVELTAVLAEGLVPLRDLPNDRWEFDADRLTLTGQKSKRRFRPGDKLRVTVAAANPQNREVDLIIADE
jgi:ribonuclease R